jgi:hypothetical protein
MSSATTVLSAYPGIGPTVVRRKWAELVIGSYPGLLESHIRGRPGFDVVGSPAELRAEVAGWPRKSTGTKASANKNELALAA